MQKKKTRSKTASKIDWSAIKVQPHHVALGSPKMRITREQVLRALALSLDSKLEFGGREWLQTFDDDAVLIATVTK